MMKISLLLLIAYLLGSIPTGLWIGKAFYHVDIREHGSGNTGTTNTFRILGAKAGLMTFIIDMLKGTLATLLPSIMGITTISPLLIGLFAVIGHTFPIFAKFKGGKAVATSAGILLGFAPLFLIYLLIIFFGTLYLFSMISLASVVAAVSAVISAFIFPILGFLLPHYSFILDCIVIVIASIIIIRHKDNMKRIRKHEENIVPWGLNLSKQKVK